MQSGPDVDLLTFRLADRARALHGVRLRQDVGVPSDQLDFTWSHGDWELLLERPEVDRIEYLLELTGRDGSTQTVPDPGNPAARQAPSARSRCSSCPATGARCGSTRRPPRATGGPSRCRRDPSVRTSTSSCGPPPASGTPGPLPWSSCMTVRSTTRWPG